MRRRKAAERDSSGGSDSSKSDKKGKGKSRRSSDGGEETTDLSGAVGVIVKLVRFAIMSVAIAMVTGLFVAGDPLWGYRGKYTKLRTYLPYREKIFSLPELAMYNGRDEKKPIYIAILGDVYDVTEGRRIYGPGGYYSFFSGRDASRAYVTGCFKTHLTYDVRDFDDQQMSGLLAWKDFYDKHAKYYKVGRVVLPPLDASVPVPEPCEDPSAPK